MGQSDKRIDVIKRSLFDSKLDLDDFLDDVERLIEVSKDLAEKLERPQEFKKERKRFLEEISKW